MSQRLNKINNQIHTKKLDRSFSDSFLAMPFEPPTFKHHKRMYIHSAASMGIYWIVEVSYH